MPYVVRIPGAPTPATETVLGLFHLAAAERERRWGEGEGGQALIIVDTETGRVVRPCLVCRGGEKQGCLTCKGAGCEPV